MAGAAGLAASTMAFTGCSSDTATASGPGGVLIHGATGGGMKDSVDPHFPVTVPDIARVRNLYEPLLRWDREYRLENCLAESIEPSKDAVTWTVRLREGLTFHHGKTVTSADVLHTLRRVTDKDKPAPAAADLIPVLDLDAMKVLDDRTIRFRLKRPYAIFDQLLAAYSMGIIPTDFDVKKPVGTGPYKYESFTPGLRSRFLRNENYWELDVPTAELVILDFADDAAKVNALLAGQVHSIDNLPTYLVDSVQAQGARSLISETGAWIPFTMRVDKEPFKDNRVRQAFRLIVNRQEMIDQALNGYGILGNDLYAPFDTMYAKDLAQREQDIDKAKSLLKAAGQSDLQVELVTSTAVGTGGVEAANLFVNQAKLAGVDVRLNKADSNVFYGDQYLSWLFAQDFWFTRNYILQAAAGSLKRSPYNETHFDDEEFTKLIDEATGELDLKRRAELLHDAQQIEYDRGGLIIWGFKKQVDGYSEFAEGFVPYREHPMSSFQFKLIRLTQ